MILQSDIVLVTGGTGFAGRILVKKLCEIGCEVRVIARKSSNISVFEGIKVKLYRGEVFDEATVLKACEGVNYVFHVAGAYREAKIPDEIYWNVHVKSTQLLSQSVTGQKNFKRFVHVSTVGVHGHIKNPPADEEYEYAPGDVYQKTKLEGELWIRNFSKKKKMPLTVIRPTAIYGPGDRRLLKLFKMAKLPIIPILGYSKGLYHLIHVEDLANFMIIASCHNRTKGEVYICGNQDSLGIKDFIKIVSNELGRAPVFVRLPVSPFYLMGYICEKVCQYFSIEPPIYRRRVAFFTKDRSFNTKKMREHTGYHYKFNNEDGIRDTVGWYVENKWL